MFCLKAPIYSICEEHGFIFFGSKNLQVGWLHIASGRSEFMNFADDPNKHKDDQIISIQSYLFEGEQKLFVQSKGGWFGCIKVSLAASTPPSCMFQLQYHLMSDFVGFCKFPLIEFKNQEQPDLRAFVKRSQKQTKCVIITNTLEVEGRLHILQVAETGFQVCTTKSEAIKYIDPPPVNFSLNRAISRRSFASKVYKMIRWR